MSNQAPPPPPPGGNQPPGGYQGPPPGGYQGPPPGGYQGGYQEQPKKGAGLAIAALVLAILGFLGSFFVLGGILSLIAIILGFVASGKAKRGQASGRGVAITGIVIGVLGLLIAGFILAVIGAFWDKASGYADCVEKAGSDQAAVDECARDFQRDVENSTNN